MDKYEYKVRAEEIKELIAKGDYPQAAEIADSIDWRRVKSVMMLCTISDLYKINRRYEDARDMLLLAYERRPGGRNICYSLCELSIKTGEFVQAMEYYKEFVQVAPKDPGRYILQYKLYADQDVSLEERIAVLEELKKRDYRERWAYELAYLYHRVGLATQCVEECDEIILWFGEGEYVTKAMELKMLHQPLTAEQQEKYEHRFEAKSSLAVSGEDEEQQGSSYNSVSGDTQVYRPVRVEADAVAEDDMEYAGSDYPEDSEFFYGEIDEESFAENFAAEETSAKVTGETGELNIQVKTMDVGQYNTLNLQAELAQGLKELLDSDTESPDHLDSDTESFDRLEIDEISEEDLGPEPEEIEDSEVFFGETGEISEIVMEQMRREEMNQTAGKKEEKDAVISAQEQAGTDALVSAEEQAGTGVAISAGEQSGADAAISAGEQPGTDAVISATKQSGIDAAITTEDPSGTDAVISEAAQPEVRVLVPEQDGQNDAPRAGIARTYYPEKAVEKQMAGVQPPKEIANVLSQGSDGQISLVIPDNTKVEKQITGQMNIQDVLAEWERMKKENQEKREEEVRQRVLRTTGNMFTEFEAAVRDGLLEQLEKGENGPEDALTENDVVEELEEIVETEDDVKEFVMIDGHAATRAGQTMTVDGDEEISESPTGDDRIGETADTEESVVDETKPSEGHEDKKAEGTKELVTETSQKSGKKGAAEESDATGETEEPANASGGETIPEENASSEDGPDKKENVRSMTPEERELYANYIQSRSTKEQIVKAVDDISLAAYTGNVIITGEPGVDTISLAKNMIREIQAADSNFSGKVAKISGKGLNRKNIEETLNQLQNGALIIQGACDMDGNTVQDLYKTLQKESLGIIVLLQDDTKVMNRFLRGNEKLLDVFTSRVDVEAPSNDVLVAYGKHYAKEQEYSIDELGVLALHNRIEERQTMDHAVTTSEVREIVNAAIRHANRKSMNHFFDILLSKRYDEEDMIIVTEKDFE